MFPLWGAPQVNVLLIAFFNWYYTFLQLEPKELAEQLKRQVRALQTPLQRERDHVQVVGYKWLSCNRVLLAFCQNANHLTNL